MSVGERAEGADVQGKAEVAKGIAEQVKETAEDKVQGLKTWSDTVSRKTEEERSRPGWKSSVFEAIAA